MGPVAAETDDELADALKRIEELEGLIAEYILREAIMQIEIKLFSTAAHRSSLLLTPPGLPRA